MNPDGRKRFRQRPAFGEAPLEKQETLADQHIKNLVQKQLDKNVTVKR